MNVVAILWGLVGWCGIIYSIVVTRRVRLQSDYEPVLEDWMFHSCLPLAAYGILVLSAFVTGSHPDTALYLVAASALVLLFVGIHNAWDAVAYHLFVRRRDRNRE